VLFDLDPGRSRTALNYEIVAQSAEEVRDIQNAPAICMGRYLIESDQVKLLTTISIYTQRGESRDQVRLLHMNAAVLPIWKAMGKDLGSSVFDPRFSIHQFRFCLVFRALPEGRPVVF
jgi:hypothetical protein